MHRTTVEFTVQFLKPATTDRLIAVGQVVQAGRTLTVCEGPVLMRRARAFLQE